MTRWVWLPWLLLAAPVLAQDDWSVKPDLGLNSVDPGWKRENHNAKQMPIAKTLQLRSVDTDWAAVGATVLVILASSVLAYFLDSRRQRRLQPPALRDVSRRSSAARPAPPTRPAVPPAPRARRG